MPDRQQQIDGRRFTVEGDPSVVLALAEAQGWTITRPRWFERTYAIPRWIVWFVAVDLALHALAGLVLIVGWLDA